MVYVFSDYVLVEGQETLRPAIFEICPSRGVFENVRLLSETELKELRKETPNTHLDAGSLAILPGVSNNKANQ